MGTATELFWNTIGIQHESLSRSADRQKVQQACKKKKIEPIEFGTN